MSDLPAPPEGNEPQTLERKPPKKGSLLNALVALFLVGSIVVGGVFLVLFLTGGSQTPSNPSKSLSVAPEARNDPPVSSNPCSEDTFEANACAARIIQISSNQLEMPPYEVVQAFCKGYATKAAQQRLVDKWVSQGAPSEKAARAVVDEILSYCPQVEGK